MFGIVERSDLVAKDPYTRVNPLGRPVQPAEPAPSYAFLASHESSCVNVETLGAACGAPLP